MPHLWERIPPDPEYRGLLPPVPKWTCRRCGSGVATFRHPSDDLRPGLEAIGAEVWVSDDCDEMLAQNLLDS